MVVRIRLARHGLKIRNRPFYHIVVANARSPRDGKHLEEVGLYDPIPNEQGIKNIELNADRIKYWLGVGAQPSNTVARLLSRAGIIPTLPKGVNKPKSKPKYSVNIDDLINGKAEKVERVEDTTEDTTEERSS